MAVVLTLALDVICLEKAKAEALGHVVWVTVCSARNHNVVHSWPNALVFGWHLAADQSAIVVA